MTQACKHAPRSPRQAVRRRGPLDRALDPVLLKALAEPARARLFACVAKCGRPCSVSEVAACCDADFSTVARHLSTLARAGALEARKEGRTVWYEARSADLASRFRAIADAIERPTGACGCRPD